MEVEHPEIGASIVKEGKLTEDTEEALVDALNKFKDKYLNKKDEEELIRPAAEF